MIVQDAPPILLINPIGAQGPQGPQGVPGDLSPAGMAASAAAIASATAAAASQGAAATSASNAAASETNAANSAASAAASSTSAGVASGRLVAATYAEFITKYGTSAGRVIPAVGDTVQVVTIGAALQRVASGGHFTSDGLQWLVMTGVDGLDVRAFGAALNNVTDDSAAINLAATAARASGVGLSAPAGQTCYIANSIDLMGIENINFKADIRVSTAIAGVPVTVGGRANVIGGKWIFGDVSDGSSVILGPPPSRPIFRVFGSKTCQIEIGNCQYMQFWADDSNSTRNSNAYNQVHFRGAVFFVELAGTGAVGWNNENFFYGGRIKKLTIDGTNYAHNHNKFVNPTMEGADVDIRMIGNVYSNQVLGARFESVGSAPGISFAATSYSNKVEISWSGTGNPRAEFVVPIAVSDAGMGNVVTTEAAYRMDKVELFSLGGGNQVLATATKAVALDPRLFPENAGVNNLTGRLVPTPSLRGVYVGTTGRWLALTDPVPVALGDVILFSADYDGALMRTYIFPLDANMQPLTNNAGGEFISQASTTFNSTFGQYSQGANITADAMRQAPASVVRSEVKFVRVGMVVFTAGLIRAAAAHLFVQPLGRSAALGAQRRETVRALDGIPTRGYAPADTVIWDHTAGAMRRCTFQYETRLNGALTAGATSVTVTTPSTIANGDLCGILLDNGETHWSAISGLSGSTFTVTAIPAGRSAPNGGRIVFNRWA